MQSNTSSGRHEGLQSIPWGSTNQQETIDYYVSDKTVVQEPLETQERRMCGLKKSRFILFLMLGVIALVITIIAAVVSADRRKPPRLSQQDSVSPAKFTATAISPSATSLGRPAPTATARTVVLMSLNCTGNTTASVFVPRDGGVTLAFGFTASCGLDCAASNIFTFEKYDVALCATTCAGRTDGQCGAMVFKYTGSSSNSNAQGANCLLTTSCGPRG